MVDDNTLAPWLDESYAGLLLPRAQPIHKRTVVMAGHVITDAQIARERTNRRRHYETRVTIEDARPSRVQIRAEMRVERRQERIAAGIEEAGRKVGCAENAQRTEQYVGSCFSRRGVTQRERKVRAHHG